MAAQEVLLEEGAPINALDMNKQSALHAAVFLLMDDMVEASDSRLRHLRQMGSFLLSNVLFAEWSWVIWGGWFQILFVPTLMRQLQICKEIETAAVYFAKDAVLFPLNRDKRSEPVGVRVVWKRAVCMTASFSPWRERHRLKSFRSWNKLVLTGPDSDFSFEGRHTAAV